ncbi:hypothetical protein Goari_016665, partial [Gossypium aridum]|nr:hypothetical protein [Gossypium aridum]
MDLNAIKRLTDADALTLHIFENPKFFDRAIGINVPRARYLPLRTTADLFLYPCDIYTLVGYVFNRKSKANSLDPVVEFGSEFFKPTDFLSRFKTMPSIIELDSLKVTGDVRFGSRVVLKGKVSIAAKPGEKLQIPDKKVIED